MFAFLGKMYRTMSGSMVLILIDLVILVVLVTLGVAYWDNPFRKDVGGLIIVDSPEVYTRERLVNDRFWQSSWLETQLKKTEEEGKLRFGNQAILDLHNLMQAKVGFRVQGAGTPPTSKGKPEPQGNDEPENQNKNGDDAKSKTNSKTDSTTQTPKADKPTASPIEAFRDMLAYREEIRTQIMETMLDDRHDIDGNTLYRLKFDTTIIPHRDTKSWAVVEVEFSPCMDENDKDIMYREWLEKTETELRNNLEASKMNFLSKTMDSNELFNFFQFLSRKLENAEDNIKAKKVPETANLDERTSKKGKEENPEKPKDRQKNGCTIATIDNKVAELNKFVDKYNTLLESCEVNTVGYFTKGCQESLDDEEYSLTRRTIRRFTEQNLAESREGTGDTQCDRYTEWIDSVEKAYAKINNEEFVKIWNKKLKEPERSEALTDKDKFKEFKEQTEKTAKNAIAAIQSAFAKEKEFLREALAEYMINTYAKIHELDDYADFGVDGCKLGFCNIKVTPEKQNEIYRCKLPNNAPNQMQPKYSGDIDDRCNDDECSDLSDKSPAECFYCALDDKQVYSYAVTPKESVQRISEITSNYRIGQFVLGMSAMLGTLATDQVTNFIKESRLLAHEIKRQPLVVGFSTENVLNGKEVKDQVAEFGWLIGPKFDLEEQGDVEFRHVPITNALSALISAPSWWNKAKVKITVCWLSPDQNTLEWVGGSDEVCNTKDGEKSNTFELRLPGDAYEIKRKLGYEVGHVPHIDSDYVGDNAVLAKFFVSQPKAKLLIRGGDLWRSTVVTMGAQKADLIEVLPDMRGIIATFDPVKEPISWEYYDKEKKERGYKCYGDLEVIVWTSEGRTQEGRFVRVYQTKDEYREGKCDPNSAKMTVN
jgi:hypothetical protein